ncbi:MAG: phage tail protein [Pseudomonadota bacterium]
MATLVLTAVGSAIGGPIGGAIGAAIGQQIDAEIFAPPARQGSRLKELVVQTSSYGTQIPGIFGAMRVAGTVIWATDLIEQRTKSGGGKGQSATVNYSYRVSLAVALSSKPVERIGRIWADGNLIRGAGGDFKVDAQMRVHHGHENQQPDPLLASAEAAGECPAHRGVAYVVFEDLQLAEFGNRIPSFTFEVVERDGPLPLSSFIGAVSGGEINAQTAFEIGGFAAAGGSIREAISPLLEICPLELVVRDSRLVVRDVSAQQTAPYQIVIAADENGRALEPPKHVMPPAANIPAHVSLRYHDADRDYQAGIQQTSAAPGGRGEMRLELPAVLSAAAAKHLAETKDSAVRYGRDYWSASVTVTATAYQPGDHFMSPDGRIWQISETEIGLGTAAIKAKLASKNRISNNIAGASGRHVPSADQPIGETRIAVVDLPLLAGGDSNKPALAIFAAGTQAGWKRAAISMRLGDQWTDIGVTAPSAIVGSARNALAPHAAYLVDTASTLDVELLNTSMSLALRDSSPMAQDAPIFWINGEFVRVGRIAALGGQVYRLSILCRGGYASAQQAPAHPIGSQVLLMDSAAALTLSANNFALGQTVSIEAQGIGDAMPASRTATVEGRAIMPLPSVHGRAIRNSDGSFKLEWKRCSRLDLGWVDGVDQALVEDQESYRVAILANDVVLREWLVAANNLHVSAGEMAATGMAQNALPIFHVWHIGRFAQSEPLIFGVSQDFHN